MRNEATMYTATINENPTQCQKIKTLMTNVLYYKTTMCVLKTLVRDGAISESELHEIDSLIADRHGLSKQSFYRENILTP